ncbi:uroporphyrinogen decarboxylase [Aliidongia dinghuensis]|uniref:Uroporphyrinogen decarboxylase n=1 Tax=Aliidongia dinghuensis TaxID=1867774 RepID=A0A8J3E5I0_9PROT|nr:uroporphyrinogen decarboxylase [Aliidongia dinghuensis]
MRTEEKLLPRALRGAPVDRHPIWLMRQAGRYLPEYREVRAKAGNFLDLCFTPELATEVTLQPIRRFGLDAAILFSDILVVPWGLKQKVGFQEGEGPKLDPIRNAAELAALVPDGMVERLAPVYETVARLKQDLPAETTLIGFAGAPWTVATYMIEGGSSRTFETCRRFATEDKTSFEALIDLLTDATIAHLDAQVAAGAEVVQLFDSWAGALEGDAFERWVMAPAKRIVAALKAKHPKLPIIGFPRGAGALYLGYAKATGIDAVSLDQDVPLGFARDVLQPAIAVQGNLDPLVLVAGGSALEERVRAIIDALGRGRFVFNLGHGIVPQTPPEHVAKLVELVRMSRPARA